MVEPKHVVAPSLFVGEGWNRHLVGQPLLYEVNRLAPPDEHAEVLGVVVERDQFDVLTPALLLPTLDDVPGYLAGHLDLVLLAELHEVFGREAVRTDSRVFHHAFLRGEELPSCLSWRYQFVYVLVWIRLH